MSRDYANFPAAAKRPFRAVADALGYEQLIPTVFAKARDGWHESFNLQVSHGTDAFYVNYGITVTQLCPFGEDQSILTCGHLLGSRLRDADGTGAFPRGSTQEIAASAERVVEQYRLQALPWFEAMGSFQAMADEYLRVNPISEEQIGRHSTGFGEGPRCATYAFLLLKAGRRDDGVRWLREAERVLSLPEYITRDGRLVHEQEPGARRQAIERSALLTRTNVQETIVQLESP